MPEFFNRCYIYKIKKFTEENSLIDQLTRRSKTYWNGRKMLFFLNVNLQNLLNIFLQLVDSDARFNRLQTIVGIECNDINFDF